MKTAKQDATEIKEIFDEINRSKFFRSFGFLEKEIVAIHMNYTNEIIQAIKEKNEVKKGNYSLERLENNPHCKPSNKHGNNGYNRYQSGRRPQRWKEVKFVENVYLEDVIKMWGSLVKHGYRITNWDNGDIILD